MSKIRINKQHFFHNLEYLTQKAGGKEKLMAVLKDNAYGHDLLIMAGLAREFGIKKAAVKNLDEALQIQEYFDEILILADHPPHRLYPDNISFAALSFEFLKTFPKHANIHLAIDTGMHRNGVQMDEIEAALAYIKANELNLKGVFTHFRSADEMNGELFWQKENFKASKARVQQWIDEHKMQMPNFHCCNSAALLRQEGALEDDFARCGIAMYGYTHIDKRIGTYDLKPVMSLVANRLNTRVLQKGQRVGYGGVYEAREDTVISTYDIGYGDGFFRYDGRGDLKIANGQKILGRVSMDSMCIAGDADEVCLFDDATELAEYFSTITYDVITKLMPWIKKEVI
ncbi:alanine racemase [Sulfurospirillum sp. 1612]|uniref:alanine racemase n=1 Tax=Sulfurospirillum sp. 1612 TaxID=3094835 RepID=UPI002F9378D3